MHNKDSENSEPEQIKEYINCFNFAYIQRLALSTNGKVGVCEFVLCEMVRGLSIKSGKCIAKNDFFAERLCLSEVQISRIIKSLCGLGLLENQRKKYGWERMVTEKYYQIVKHEKKHLSLREYEKAGLKIVAPTEPRQPEKKPRAAKTAANRTEKSEPEQAYAPGEYVASLYAAAPKTRLSLSEYEHIFGLINSEFARSNISAENRKKAAPHFINLFLAAKEKELPTHPYGLMRKDIKPYFEDWRRESWRHALGEVSDILGVPTAPTFGESCAHLLNLPKDYAVQLAHRLALIFRLPNDEVILKCVTGFSVWAARENITLLNNDNLSEIIQTYFEYIIAKNSEKNG